MKKIMTAALLALAAAPARAQLAAPPVQVAAGQPAPDFTLKDQTGAERKLSDSKGKYVVLEWWNKDCPFVRRQYKTKNMQSLQKKYTDLGFVWYSIDSSAKGKEGYLAPKEAAPAMKAHGLASTAVLLDPKGEVGRLYGAKTTPHMFVIDPKGTLIYMGAIDSNPSTDAAVDPKAAHNYVAAAIEASLASQPIPNPVTQAYGCSVKY